MLTNRVEKDYRSIIEKLLSESDGTVFVVQPSSEALEALVETATAYDGDLPTLQVLAEEAVCKDLRREFLVASRAADLVASDALELRSADPEQGNHLYVTEAGVHAVVAAGSHVALLSTDDEEFTTAAGDRCAAQWESADSFDLRTPPRSRVDGALREDIGEDVAETFSSVLDSVEAVRGDDELDEVALSLLVAAKHEVLLYDISKWGEDIGVASKATFSRVKNKLEDAGLLTTEKVPMDIGRPRLRLLLGDDRLKAADPDELVDVAYELLDA
ncbi:transcriptional regulator TbsP [Salinirubrum litoreum]|uniref:Transcriptional regulator TbsP n=1 Tax=Salinirubrum litoreum TaxID=1126234 RepID=A0ABD5RBU5_9EURY|nr:DUF5821 family protein [Salinirubrum litoreum]